MMLLSKLSDILDSADPANPANPADQPWPAELHETGRPQDQPTSAPVSPANDAVTLGSAKMTSAGSNSSAGSQVVGVPAAAAAVQDTSSSSGEAAVGSRSGSGACGSKGISEWEVVSAGSTAAASGYPSSTGSASSGKPSTNTPSVEPRPRAEDALAEEAARMLRLAASAAEALAPRLPGALRRAEIAEAEVVRLRAALEAAEARIESMEKQQEQISQGFVSEIRQRDAEIAAYKAAATAATSSSTPPEAALPSPRSSESLDVVTFFAEGPLGLEFDQSNACLKLISAVDANSQSAGRVTPGDEVVSINGVPARSLSWEELAEVLSARPAVVSVRRAYTDSAGVDAGRGAKNITDRLRFIAGWTGAAAVRAVRAAMTDNEDVERRPDEDELPMDDMPSEVRNRPFYELVRASMAEACTLETKETGSLSGDEATFERWLRQFHSERDDEWYESNHVRVYNAFKPHWDEVVAAQREIAAS